jgi:hypothetical protein
MGIFVDACTDVRYANKYLFMYSCQFWPSSKIVLMIMDFNVKYYLYCRYVLTIVDYMSKWPKAYSIFTKSAQEVASKIEDTFIHVYWFDWFDFWCHFQQYFSYIMVIIFSGGGNRSTGREPSTLCKLLV